MRVVRFPDKNIQLVDPLSGSLGDHVAPKRWMLVCVLNDQRMGATPLQIANVVHMRDKALAHVPGGELHLEDEEWDAGKPIVESPQINIDPRFPYQPLVMCQLEPYRRAFLDAQYVNDAKAKAEKKK